MAALTVLERRERFFLGVDVGCRTHVVCALPRSLFEQGDSRWQHAPTLTVPVSRPGYEKISALLARLTDDPARDVVAGLEPTGGYYARTVHAYLASLGLEVRWIKNNAVHDARDAVYGKKTKTDAADARLIARLLYLREAVGQEYAFTAGHNQIGVYATLRLLVNNRWKLRQAQALSCLAKVRDLLRISARPWPTAFHPSMRSRHASAAIASSASALKIRPTIGPLASAQPRLIPACCASRSGLAPASSRSSATALSKSSIRPRAV